MSWSLDDLEQSARREERLAERARTAELRGPHLIAAARLRARATRMRSRFRASLGLVRP